MTDSLRWSEDDLAKYLTKFRKPVLSQPPPVQAPSSNGSSMRPRKYRNRKELVTFLGQEIVAGHVRLCHEFDSEKEAAHYRALCLRRHAGDIADLRLQEPFPLIVKALDGSGVIVGEWYADFTYNDLAEKRHVVADVKSEGTKTAVYELKKKIIEACHGFRIEEV
jgi:uncharacterized protein DUF1064